MQTIVTHSGSFDPDDVLAVALVTIHLGKGNYEVVRSRKNEIIEKADWVVDVGGVYDRDKKRFDHHQNDVPKRDNGVPYSSFGLVWDELGEELSGSKEIADRIEKKMVYPIDAADNAVEVCCSCGNDINSYEFYDIINTYKPVWGSEEDFYTGFMRAVSFARKLLRRQIAIEAGEVAMINYAKSVYEQSENKEILEFDKPVMRHVLAELPEVKGFVSPIFDTTSTNWMAVTVPEGTQSFTNRISFPAEWGGKYRQDLRDIAGFDGIMFCHKELYLVAADCKESALKALSHAK